MQAFDKKHNRLGMSCGYHHFLNSLRGAMLSSVYFSIKPSYIALLRHALALRTTCATPAAVSFWRGDKKIGCIHHHPSVMVIQQRSRPSLGAGHTWKSKCCKTISISKHQALYMYSNSIVCSKGCRNAHNTSEERGKAMYSKTSL